VRALSVQVRYHGDMAGVGVPSHLAELVQQLAAVLREYPEIAAAYLFGSVVRGDQRPESDIDLGLVLAAGHPSHDDCHRLLGELAARLEIVTAPRPLDLVILGHQGPVFCHEVLLEGCLILESDRERRIDFESDTIIRALDFRPTLELARQGYVDGYRRWLRSYRDRERHRTPA
jgi:predicted nucleotidyltransferase